jgi:hypothetical protein
MPLPAGFRANPFVYMANASLAELPFCPSSVEDEVQNYLMRLSTAVSKDVFLADNHVQALVFGEWGHGKSQVVYRTAHMLKEKHPGVLCLRIVPENLTPSGILKAALAEVARLGLDATPVRSALEKVANFKSSDLRAIPDVTKALLALTQRCDGRRFLHAVLLFDEAQTMGTDFQRFLQELVREFRDASVSLHTMQCHSLASLDEARRVANSLKQWLDTAAQLHLPSVQPDDADEFFRVRLRKFTDDDTLAETFIPDGVAKTICYAAGGNPRRMIQFADLAASQWSPGQETARLTGRHVVASFGGAPGADAHYRLFREDRFREVCQLAPQEHAGQRGVMLAAFLEDNIDRLYGETAKLTPGEMAQWIGRRFPSENATQFIARVSASVADINLLKDEKDDFQNTVYGLSPTFRGYLSNSFASAGSGERIDKQFRLMFRAKESQNVIVMGLFNVLRQGAMMIGEEQVLLGEDTGMIGMVADMPMPDDKFVHAKVLITAFCNVTPTQAVYTAIGEGLRSGRWDRAMVLYHNEHASWGGELEVQSRRGATVEVINDTVWQPWMKNLGPAEETLATKAVRLFATIWEPDGGDADELLCHVREAVRDRQLTKAQVCYVPTGDEYSLLSSNAWKRGEALTKQELEQAGVDPRTLPRTLAALRDTFIDSPSRGRFSRKPPRQWPLYQAVEEALKEHKQLTVSVLAEHLKRRRVRISRTENVEQMLLWICQTLCDEQRARRSPDEGVPAFAFVDLRASLRTASKESKDQLTKLKEATQLLAKVSRRECEAFTQKEKAFTADLAALNRRADDGQTITGLRALRADIEKCLQDVEKKRAELLEKARARREQHERECKRIDELRATLPPNWQSLLCPQSFVDDLSQLHADVDAVLEALLDEPQAARKSRPEDLLDVLDGDSMKLARACTAALHALQGERQTKEPLDELMNAVARHYSNKSSFSEIVVHAQGGS